MTSAEVIRQAGGLGIFYNLSLSEAIAIGIIPSSVARTGQSNGYVETAATSSRTIRATTYTEQGNNAQRSVGSSSALDTSAGTGARSVTITYLDQTMAGPFTETVTLNGTTPVNTSNSNIAFIESIQVASVGSTGGNQGTITLFISTAGGGGTIGTIAAQDNKTYWAHHYVPSTVTCFIVALRGGSTIVDGSITFNTLNPLDNTIPQLNPAETIRHDTTTNSVEYVVPITVSGPAIIFLNERPDISTASTTYASFSWYQL